MANKPPRRCCGQSAKQFVFEIFFLNKADIIVGIANGQNEKEAANTIPMIYEGAYKAKAKNTGKEYKF